MKDDAILYVPARAQRWWRRGIKCLAMVSAGMGLGWLSREWQARHEMSDEQARHRVAIEAMRHYPAWEDPRTAEEERVETEPPHWPQPYSVGMSYQDAAGNRWRYLGGNPALRLAWRVTNAGGGAVMPRPTPGHDAASIYSGFGWKDGLGAMWTYTGALDGNGSPLVYTSTKEAMEMPVQFDDAVPVRKATAVKSAAQFLDGDPDN